MSLSLQPYLQPVSDSELPPAPSVGTCCPHCQHSDSIVIETRDNPQGRRRRRQCLGCKKRFTTQEVVILVDEEQKKAARLRKLERFMENIQQAFAELNYEEGNEDNG